MSVLAGMRANVHLPARQLKIQGSRKGFENRRISVPLFGYTHDIIIMDNGRWAVEKKPWREVDYVQKTQGWNSNAIDLSWEITLK